MLAGCCETDPPLKSIFAGALRLFGGCYLSRPCMIVGYTHDMSPFHGAIAIEIPG